MSRQISELLELVEKDISNERFFFGGLCSRVVNLYSKSIITLEERIVLKNYIEKNIPITYHTLKCRIENFRFWGPIATYWWHPLNKKARLKWLNKHIKKNMR